MLPQRWQRHNRRIQLGAGIVLTVAYAALTLWRGALDSEHARALLVFMNLVTITLLHAKPMHTLGLVWCLAAIAGAWPLEQRFGFWAPTLLLAGQVLAHGMRHLKAMAVLLAIGFGMAAVLLLEPGAGPMMPGSNRALEAVLAVHVPLVALTYTWGCWLFMDLLPRRLGQPMVMIDLGRLVKTVQVPMSLMAIALIQRCVQALAGEPLWRSRVPATLILMSLAAAVVVDWIRWYGTPAHQRRLLERFRRVPRWLLPIPALHQRADDWRRRHAEDDPASELALFEWVRRAIPEQAVFHVVSEDHWLAFNLRANTLRSITGSWKDGGMLSYADAPRLIEWQRRMQLVQASIANRSAARIAANAASLGAEFAVVSKRVLPAGMTPPGIVYENDRYVVLPSDLHAQTPASTQPAHASALHGV